MIKYFFFLAVLLNLGCPSFGQKYTNYTTQHGLPSNHVYKTLQDKQGFMWFLTDKGIVKYDGHTFRTFTTRDGLPNNDVWEAFITPDQKFWYLSKSASLGYIENDSVYDFPNEKTGETMNPLFSSQIGNDVYPTGPMHTYKLKNEKWTSIHENRFNADGLTVIHHKKIKAFVLKQTVDSLLFINSDSVVVDRVFLPMPFVTTGKRGQVTDSLFYWATNKTISIYNLNTLKLKQIDVFEEIGLSGVEHIRLNAVNGRIQVTGTGFIGFLSENYHIEDVFFFPEDIQAHFGFMDHSKTLWLSTFSNGVYKLPFAKRDIKYVLPNSKIQSLNFVNNTLVAGVYNKGFYNYNKKEIDFELIQSSKQYNYETFEIPELNHIYYSGETHLYVKKINEKNIYPKKIGPGEGFKELKFFQNKLYSVFAFGLHLLDHETLKIKNVFYQKGCKDLLIFQDQLLIAGAFGLKTLEEDTILPLQHLLFDKPVLNIQAINDSVLLINTDGFGSYISDLESVWPIKGSAFLSVEDAFCEYDALWLATNKGVLKYVLQHNLYKLQQTFTIENGLPTNNINCLFVNQQHLIIGSNNGIAFIPKNENHTSLLMDVYIKNITYNQQRISESEGDFKFKRNNVVNFTLGNIDFSDHKTAFEYEYKFEPLHETWRKVKSDVFSFNNLEPNHYTFRLKTKQGEVSKSINILPLYWQTLWFKGVVGVFVLVILILGIRQYFKKSKEKQLKVVHQKRQFSELQLKALRSQMNPHFVFNALSAIQYYINTNDFETSENYLVKFSRLIRQYFELSKEQEISLETEIKLLTDYLDLEQLRFKDKLNYKFVVDDELNIKQMTIPTMLLQPVVENAVNHGIFNKIKDGNVDIVFEFHNSNTFKVSISDDGVGVQNTLNKKHKSVNSSKVRTERILFLNQSGKWKIDCEEKELFPNKEDKGHQTHFIISRI
ncbi:MAG: histidine kinase [Flavobacteriales bacterium]